MLEIPNIFGGMNARVVDAGPEPTYEEKNESIPWDSVSTISLL